MIEIGFEWPVARSFQILDPGSEKRARRSTQEKMLGLHEPKIAPKGKAFDRKRPLEINPVLYLEFADLDRTPEACLAFAEKWGLLGLWLGPTKDFKGEDLSQWYEEVKKMRQAVDAWRDGSFMPARYLPPLANLQMRLVEGPSHDNPYRLQIEPKSLIGAMWLQFAQAVASGESIASCAHCGGWFETGARGSRRRGAKFCSDRCRFDYNNARRAKGASS